jgi:hypothetical protein
VLANGFWLTDRVKPPGVRLQGRQPIEPILDRRRLRQDALEGVRRHAKASRHTDAFDPRKLPQVRALAANDRNLGLVDLLEIQHVAAHPLTSLGVAPVNFTPVDWFQPFS